VTITMLTDALRDFFDNQLEAVMAELPPRIHELLEDVPMIVDDYPSREILRRMNLRRRDELCGLYTGVPLIDRGVGLSGVPSDVIHLFRLGILRMSQSHGGRLDEAELRRQIRITILHELGHHHGFDEDELEELGY
jgi:predicted Zn-dependent protease with MMP-like domain